MKQIGAISMPVTIHWEKFGAFGLLLAKVAVLGAAVTYIFSCSLL
jgi:hypothetical protein